MPILLIPSKVLTNLDFPAIKLFFKIVFTLIIKKISLQLNIWLYYRNKHIIRTDNGGRI